MIEYFNVLRGTDFISIFLKILLAVILGGILGMERGRKHRPAGLRTYMLVCLGSALVMMTNLYIFEYFNTSDPVRMGAQVVSGVGFLCAGTIIITSKNQVKGMTTAAGLWAAACGGLAIGAGFYEGALLGGVAIYLVMVTMQRFNKTLYDKSNLMDIYVEYGGDEAFSSFLMFARSKGLEISEIQLNRNEYVRDALICATLTVISSTKRTHVEMIKMLGEVPGVKHIEEIS